MVCNLQTGQDAKEGPRKEGGGSVFDRALVLEAQVTGAWKGYPARGSLLGHELMGMLCICFL